jgi:hypothetical protein
MNAEKFLKLKDEITQAKLEKAQIEGALQQNLGRLKKEFGCSTLELGKKKLAQLKAEDEKLTDQIADAAEELEEKYGEL